MVEEPLWILGQESIMQCMRDLKYHYMEFVGLRSQVMGNIKAIKTDPRAP